MKFRFQTHMRILILGIVVNLLLLSSCRQEDADEPVMKDVQVYMDSLNYDGDMFEVSLPRSYSVKKMGTYIEITSYLFYDSLQKPIMGLTYGSHTDMRRFQKLRKKDELDTFFLDTIFNEKSLEEDPPITRKVYVFDIGLSSQRLKSKVREKDRKKYMDDGYEIVNDSVWIYPPETLWFYYDSTQVDEAVCKKIISSLKYRRPIVQGKSR